MEHHRFTALSFGWAPNATFKKVRRYAPMCPREELSCKFAVFWAQGMLNIRWRKRTPLMNRRIAAYFPEAGSVPMRGVILTMRRLKWFRWTAFLALLCAIGLYVAEASHHHKTETGELRCPVCHTIAHGALDLFVPAVDAAPQPTLGFLLKLPRARDSVLPQSFAVRPQSRAPPFFLFVP